MLTSSSAAARRPECSCNKCYTPRPIFRRPARPCTLTVCAACLPCSQIPNLRNMRRMRAHCSICPPSSVSGTFWSTQTSVTTTDLPGRHASVPRCKSERSPSHAMKMMMMMMMMHGQDEGQSAAGVHRGPAQAGEAHQGQTAERHPDSKDLRCGMRETFPHAPEALVHAAVGVSQMFVAVPSPPLMQ